MLKHGKEEGKREGIREGKEEGIRENKLDVAKNLLARGMEIGVISEIVGISEEEIKKLKGVLLLKYLHTLGKPHDFPSAERNKSSIPMIPLKMIESWLLADEIAFTTYFGRQPTNPPLPRHPELIWGDENDPTSDHPKNYLKRVLDQYRSQGSRDTFISIAENITIGVLRRKCPISFETFYQDVQVIS